MIGPAVDRDFEFVALKPLLEFARGGIDHFEIEVGMTAAQIVDQDEKRRGRDRAHDAEPEGDAPGSS